MGKGGGRATLSGGNGQRDEIPVVNHSQPPHSFTSNSLDPPQVTIDTLIPESIRRYEFSDVRALLPEYAIMGCNEVEVKGNFQTDSFVSMKGGYGGDNIGKEGSIYTNGKFKAEGNVLISGDVELGPGGAKKIIGNAKVEGKVIKLSEAKLCPPVNLDDEFEFVKKYNDNRNIPSMFLSDGYLVLDDTDTLTLPSGVYYLKGIKLTDEANLGFSGITFIFVEEDVNIKGASQVGLFSIELRLFARGNIEVEGNSVVYGIFLTLSDFKIRGNARIYGGVNCRDFEGEGNAFVHFDRSLPIMNKYVRQNFLFDLRHPILRLAEGYSLDMVKPILESYKIKVIGQFGELIISEIENLNVYSYLREGIEGIEFAGNAFIAPGGAFEIVCNNEIIVDFKIASTDEDIQKFIYEHNLSIEKVLGTKWLNLKSNARVTFDLLSIFDEIRNDFRVFSSAPNYCVFPQLFGIVLPPTITPNDPYYNQQWNLTKVNAPYGWALIYNGTLSNILPVYSYVFDSIVSVVDTGVRPDHEDLSQVLTDGESAWWWPHGTMVAGIAGAYTNNSTGVAGIQWGRPNIDLIIPFAVFFEWNLSDMVSNITQAWVNGANTINASWGWSYYNIPDADTQIQIPNAIATAVHCGRGGTDDCRFQYNPNGTCQLVAGTPGQGLIFSEAAGNDSGCCEDINTCYMEEYDYGGSATGPCDFPCTFIENRECTDFNATRPHTCLCPVAWPAELANTDCFNRRIVVVASTDNNDQRSFFSSVGPSITVSAPGQDILSTYSQSYQSYEIGSGTSFSAPHVTGLSGLINKLVPAIPVEDIYDIIINTSNDLGPPGWDNEYGHGRINVGRAITWTLFQNEPAYDPNHIGEPLPDTLYIPYPWSIGNTYTVHLSFQNSGTGPLYFAVHLSGGGYNTIAYFTNEYIPPSARRGKAVGVVGAGMAGLLPITFELIDTKYWITETYTVKIHTNYGIEPRDLQEFGGTLPFPMIEDSDFGNSSTAVYTYNITVTLEEPPGGGPGFSCDVCEELCKIPFCYLRTRKGLCLIWGLPVGWLLNPIGCLLCTIICMDPGVITSPDCVVCSEKMFNKEPDALSTDECRLCAEEVVAGGYAPSRECEVCYMSIRDYGDDGIDIPECHECLYLVKKIYETYKEELGE